MTLLALTKIGSQYWLYAIAGAVCLVAFVSLILVPALSSHGRIWEKAAAGFLSLFVLAVLVAVGVGVGMIVVYYFNDISDFVNGL